MATYILANGKEVENISGLQQFLKAHNIQFSSKENSTSLLQKCNSVIQVHRDKKKANKLQSFAETKKHSNSNSNQSFTSAISYAPIQRSFENPVDGRNSFHLKLNNVDTDEHDTELKNLALISIQEFLATKHPLAWDTTLRDALVYNNALMTVLLNTGIAREWELNGNDYILKRQIIAASKETIVAGKKQGNYQEGGFIPYNIKQPVIVGLDGEWLKPNHQLAKDGYCQKDLYFWQIQESLYTTQKPDYSIKILINNNVVFDYDATKCEAPSKNAKEQRNQQFNRVLTGRKTQFKPQTTAINSFWNDSLYSGVFNNPLASQTNNLPTQLRFTYSKGEIYVDRYACGGEFVTWFRLGKVQILQDTSYKWYPIDGNISYQSFLQVLNKGGVFPSNVSWRTKNELPFNYQNVEFDEESNILYGLTSVTRHPIATYSLDTYREIPTINIAYLMKPDCLDDIKAGVYVKLAEDWLRKESRAVAKQNKLDNKTEFNNVELKRVQNKVAFVARCLDRLYVLSNNDLQYYAKHLYSLLTNQWNASKIAEELRETSGEINIRPLYQDGTNLLCDMKLIESKALYHEYITPLVEQLLQTSLVVRG